MTMQDREPQRMAKGTVNIDLLIFAGGKAPLFPGTPPRGSAHFRRGETPALKDSWKLLWGWKTWRASLLLSCLPPPSFLASKVGPLPLLPQTGGQGDPVPGATQKASEPGSKSTPSQLPSQAGQEKDAPQASAQPPSLPPHPALASCFDFVFISLLKPCKQKH